MLDDHAASGVVAFIQFATVLWVGIKRANIMSNAFVTVLATLVRNRFVAVGLVFLALGLLVLGVGRYGLVNALPNEQHVERNRENNRMMISEDADGCMDMRTLGRSNGVYMSIKPCKPHDKKDQANQ